MILNSCCRRLSRTAAVIRERNHVRKISSNVKYRAACANVNVDVWSPRLCHVNTEYRRMGVMEFVSSSVGDKQENCWKCGKNIEETRFCSQCQSLQRPPSEVNYFKLLGLEETFRVDEVKLSKIYKDLQKMLHPDKYSNKEKTEQEISAEYSSLVNKAYSTLLQPLSRGMYMLKMRGVEISEETQVESAFLHEIMERNEEVEEAETEEQVIKLYKEIKQVLGGLIEELAVALDNEDVNKAKDVVVRMKYYTSIETQLKGTIRRMGIVE